MTLRAISVFVPFPKARYRLIIGLDGDWLCYECSLRNHWMFNFRGKIKFLE